jgi:hypothetical protein
MLDLFLTVSKLGGLSQSQDKCRFRHDHGVEWPQGGGEWRVALLHFLYGKLLDFSSHVRH